MTHTPKPWRWQQHGGDYNCWGGKHQRVLTIRDGVIPMIEDQRLIEAAPELLEACESCANWLGEYVTQYATDDPLMEGEVALLHKIRAAIAKAESSVV